MAPRLPRAAKVRSAGGTHIPPEWDGSGDTRWVPNPGTPEDPYGGGITKAPIPRRAPPGGEDEYGKGPNANFTTSPRLKITTTHIPASHLTSNHLSMLAQLLRSV
jgi:hypothetical protein